MNFDDRKVGWSDNYTSISKGRPDNSGVGYSSNVTTGWQPSCTCAAHEPTPCVVLDPFSGSGTTAKVAARLGRRGWGVDISQEYLTDITAARMGDRFQMEMIR